MRVAAVAAAMLVALFASDASATARYLTPPQAGDALELARRYLARGGRAAAGPVPSDADLRLQDRYRDARTGVTHIVLQQWIDGIPVWNGDAMVNISPDGAIINAHERFASAPAQSLAPRAALTADDALREVERLLDLTLDTLPTRQMYWRDPAGRAHLVWNLQVREPGGQHWWDLNIDAYSGALRSQVDWRWDDAYRVYPLPVQSPDEGARSLVVDPADAAGSPFAWHDTNGSAGAESLTTSGNNAFVDGDTNGDDVLDSASPPGGTGLVFDLALDLAQPPASNLQASIVQAFYTTNRLHDIHYQYGFDEASGNFQVNNYGAGGAGNDPVVVHVQDNELRNNARMFVPPEGTPPLMELFLFDGTPGLEVAAPAGLVGRRAAAGAEFGPPLTSPGVSGQLVLAMDATPPATDGCSALVNAAEISGRIALIDRGSCFFVEKVLLAQDAGAIAVVIANNQGNDVFLMGQADPPLPDPAIPSLLIGIDDGAELKSALAQGVTASLAAAGPDRDSAFDSGLVIHEYGHGVSVRRTGGPSNSGCLTNLQPNGMGEGWSDFWALALTARAQDAGPDPKAIAGYVLGDSQPIGFRNFPYSTNLGVNPLSFADLPGLSEEHDVGEIWAAALWDVYWNLVDEQGFDADLIAGTGGNNSALELVMDALPLQPCNPTMLEGRDAILLADVAVSGSANECAIWSGFAKRGMGVSADDGGSSNTNQVTAGFDVPIQCPEPSARWLACAALLTTVVHRRATPRSLVHRKQRVGNSDLRSSTRRP